jgi:hypothetical protein
VFKPQTAPHRGGREGGKERQRQREAEREKRGRRERDNLRQEFVVPKATKI